MTARAKPTPPAKPRGVVVTLPHVSRAPAFDEPRQREPVSPLDRIARAMLGRFSAGVSPAALSAAFFDWGVHLAASPGKQAFLMEKAGRKALRYWTHLLHCLSQGHQMQMCIEPLPQDRRFDHPAWRLMPYHAIWQSFLLYQQWVYNATTDVHGVSQHHEDVVTFVMRQLLDMASPSNFVMTNPEVQEAAIKHGGANFARGFSNMVEDWQRAVLGKPPVGAEDFMPGETVAVTRGKVVARNRLMELIQYSPATPDVFAEPVLIVPAWIMKYYILDLSPRNSLVKYLVDRGHTVFMVSWKNPEAADRDMGMADYLRLGPHAAIETVGRICPNRQIHGVGYCLGGTLMAIAAAALARDGKDPFKTLTLLAAQADFTEAGELMLFIDDAQVSFLEDIMWSQGFLDTKQMAGAFQLLRSSDLVWSRLVRDYMLGDRAPLSDLMAWNADATRMPYRMHSEYLRGLFLNNDLAEGRYQVDDRPVSLTDIRAPVFAVGTRRDHVAPWQSVYKVNQLTDADVTFLLASGGHNAGIVSPPEAGAPGAGRFYQTAARLRGDRHVPPETFAAQTPTADGSWWPCWADWLARHSTARTPPPAMGGLGADALALDDAPGRYVLVA